MVKEETSNATVNGKGSIAVRCEKEMTLISVGPIRFDSVHSGCSSELLWDVN